MNKTPENLTPPSMSKQDIILSSSIQHAIEIESTFKLYAYRVISQEVYISRIKELINLYNSTIASELKEKLNGQLSQENAL